MQISVEQLGICENCGVWFSIDELTPHQVIGQKPCRRCRNIFTEKSLGMNCVGVGGLYKKVCWVDLHGKWVYERPTRSFRLGLWEVVPEIERNFPEDKIRRQDLKYVVWCQKWCIEDKLGSTCPYGYFLYRIQKHFNDFAKRTEIQTDEMFFGIFLDGKPYQCTVPVKQFNQIRSEGEHYPYTPSPELFDASQFGENVIPFIVVEGMK